MLGRLDDTYHHELSPVNNDVAFLTTRFKSLVFKHIPRASNKVAHCLAQYALSMAVGHKMFLNPLPFTKVSYEGDIERMNKKTGTEGNTTRQGEQAVIDLEASSTTIPTSETITTQIIFGTLPATVTLTANDVRRKGKMRIDEEQEGLASS